MDLTPTESDRLLLFLAAELARARRARGLRLNVPETIAVVADAVAEAARDGRSVDEAVAVGLSVVGPQDVLPGVADIVSQVQVEAVFDDGSRLVTVYDPVGGGHLGASAPGAVVPGTDDGSPGDVAGRVVVTVVNEADVPVSVTSHFHFFEVNPRLRFDRAAAYGMRVDLPAGAVVRFDPGATVPVALRPIGGARVVVGFAGLVDGPLDAPGARDEALRRARACGFLDTGAESAAPVETADGAVGRVVRRLRADGLPR